MDGDSETDESVAGERSTALEANTGRGVPTLSLHETRPGRKLLTEEDNVDGWISTDVTVDVRE
ncbi:hypothetical protein [Halorubellus salinus]|uniref:hypothetical protein n=1 Tax=Halorubellus salinus TaxID=755309 RepID=UPI001D087020|nr:hypothetical protein [Halorubellus salinus]